MAITAKISNYILYVHLEGQFLSISRPPTKMQVGIGLKLVYENVNHNLVYAMANPFEKHGMNCSSINNHGLDHYIIKATLWKLQSLKYETEWVWVFTECRWLLPKKVWLFNSNVDQSIKWKKLQHEYWIRRW